MKIMLCNDTGVKSHIGCRAVSDAHARMLGRLGHAVTRRFFVNEIRDDELDRFDDCIAYIERHEGFMAALDAVDAVVVNGEGTIHHGSGIALVAALHVAKRRNKATFLVNCLFEEIGFDASLLNGFDHLGVRETRSAAYVRSSGVRCVQTLDSIVAAQFDPEASDELNGRVVFTDWTARNNDVAGAISAECMSMRGASGSSLFAVHGDNGGLDRWRSARAKLASAKVVVSSRHHGLYLAGLARTPFITIPGRTWKSEALLETLGSALPVARSVSDVMAGVERIDEHRRAFERAYEQLEEQSGLQHFAMLGQSSDSSEAAEVKRLREDIERRGDLLRKDDKNVEKRRAQESKQMSRFDRSSFLRRLFRGRG